MDKSPIRIMIVDDHKLVTSALASLLNFEKHLEVVAIAHSPEEALEKADQLMVQAKLDLVFMDIEFGDKQQRGLECAKQLLQNSKAFSKGIKVIMLTGKENKGFIKRAKDIGIQGYLRKNCDHEIMLNAIRVVMNEGSYIQSGLEDEAKPEINLNGSPKELKEKVLLLIAKNYNNEAIAETLHLNIKKVERIKKKLYEEYGVKNALGLVLEASKRGKINIE